jgi:ABC-2 type transport system permease protein
VRLLSLFRKTLLENIRDWKILVLTLVFGPFFVILMYFYLGETTQSSYRVIVVNQDEGATSADGRVLNAGRELISEMMDARYPEGTEVFQVQQEEDLAVAGSRLADDSVDLVVEIPQNFSSVLLDYRQGHQPPPATVNTYGNPTSANYLMAAVWSDMITYGYVVAVTGLQSPLELRANTVSGTVTLNEFELYVPALLTLALIMLMFTAAASLIREKDKGTIVRLRLSNMTAFEWFSAVSLTQIIVGLLAMGLTFLTAVALGYRTSGSLVAMMVVGLVSSLSIIAISFLVAASLRTIFDLLTIGCFPFFILMFFSGGMFPLPPLRLFTVGSRSVSINDFLPTTHTISALDSILNYGAGLRDVLLELAAISILTVGFFAMGVWLFTRRHMRAQEA